MTTSSASLYFLYDIGLIVYGSEHLPTCLAIFWLGCFNFLVNVIYRITFNGCCGSLKRGWWIRLQWDPVAGNSLPLKTQINFPFFCPWCHCGVFLQPLPLYSFLAFEKKEMLFCYFLISSFFHLSNFITIESHSKAP